MLNLQTPIKYNMAIYEGSYFIRNFTIKSKETNAAVDLTGHTARAQVRTTPTSAVLFSFDCRITAPTTGVIDVELLATASDGIKLVKGYWDLEVVPPEGEGFTTRLVMGECTISPQITKQA